MDLIIIPLNFQDILPNYKSASHREAFTFKKKSFFFQVLQRVQRSPAGVQQKAGLVPPWRLSFLCPVMMKIRIEN